MGYCPADCTDNTLIDSNPGQCDLQPRKRGIDRLMFFLCDTDLPDPMNCANMTALHNAGDIVFSSPLAQITIDDPTIEELEIADCLPALQVVTGRRVNFQDRIGIVKSNESPWTSGRRNFHDYEFWADKKEKNMRLRYGFVYCDGSVTIPKDENGNPMTSNLTVFLSSERQGTGGNAYTLEFKKGYIDFKGDPLDMSNSLPEEDGLGNVFNIAECNLF